jgi:murein L,D-transpeptidase YcbB/YkuD
VEDGDLVERGDLMEDLLEEDLLEEGLLSHSQYHRRRHVNTAIIRIRMWKQHPRIETVVINIPCFPARSFNSCNGKEVIEEKQMFTMPNMTPNYVFNTRVCL